MRNVLRVRTGFVMALAAFLSGCSGAITPGGPTAPPAVSNAATDPAIQTALTVRVLERGTGRPLPEVLVLHNSHVVAQTDVDGMAQATVPVGVEFQIDVEADGFVSVGAAGTVMQQERWTFYLERQP